MVANLGTHKEDDILESIDNEFDELPAAAINIDLNQYGANNASWTSFVVWSSGLATEAKYRKVINALLISQIGNALLIAHFK